MKTRIKYIKKNNAWYYAVQVKKCVFWKTIYIDGVFANIEKFLDTLVQVEDANNNIKSLNKIVCNGWAVRNVYKNTGPAFSIGFFDSPVHKYNHNDQSSETTWADINNSIIPDIEINTKKLFGKECLEPMKLRITIQQIEE